jgi:hypothetical protein
MPPHRFLCSPLGYRPTHSFAGGLSLGTAVAISGAAVSPINLGVTQPSRGASLLLSLLTLRLGLWVGNPKDPRRWILPSPRWALAPLTREAFGLTDAENPYVYLSDGGHFDNLGLYEMLLRRCRYIVVSDAGQDQTASFNDLKAVIDRAHKDLGISIQFQATTVVSPLVKNVAVGRIAYSSVDWPGQSDGILVYIKPIVPNDVIDGVNAVAMEEPLFPHTSTFNQNYTERRFNAYRALGAYVVRTITQDLLGEPRPLSEWAELLLRRVTSEEC